MSRRSRKFCRIPVPLENYVFRFVLFHFLLIDFITTHSDTKRFRLLSKKTCANWNCHAVLSPTIFVFVKKTEHAEENYIMARHVLQCEFFLTWERDVLSVHLNMCSCVWHVLLIFQLDTTMATKIATLVLRLFYIDCNRARVQVR